MATQKPVMTLTLNDLEKSAKPVTTTTDQHDESCGCCCCKPKWLQKFARPLAYLISICCLFLSQSSLIAGYVSGIVTNLEKRYDLSTSQIGYMLSSFDIMAVFAVFLVSYFGDQFNRAHCLGYGAVTMAIGAGVFCMPQWFGEEYSKYASYQDSGDEESNDTVMQDVNICNYTDPISPLGTLECTDYSPQVWALAVFIVAMLILSLGSAPVYILGPTYLYDNVAPKNYSLYAGILYSMVALGPAAGFLIGAAFISIYVDPWAQPPGSSEDDRQWVGAWWMGLIVCSGLLLLSSFPLLMFPRSLPGKDWKDETMPGDDSRPTMPGFGSNIKEMPKKTCALLCNPTFVFATMVMVMEQCVTSGFLAFIAKYFQVSFDMAASNANIITGAVIIPGAVAGIITGGLIMRRLQLPVVSITKFLLVLGMLPVLAVTALLFLGCKNIDLAGITTNYGYLSYEQESPPNLLDQYKIHYKENLTDSCNMNCRCNSITYQPVCGGDDITYFSPCHAGCTELQVYYNEEGMMVRNYSACACMYEDFVHQSTEATVGKCDKSCVNMYPAMVILFIVVFLTCCGQNPILLITLRCVESDQRSFAMGIQNIIVRILAQIPAPILFGTVFDNECILWTETCDGKGACLEYNIEQLPFMFFGVSLGIKCLSYVFIVLLYIAARYAASKTKEVAMENGVGGGGGDGHRNQAFDNDDDDDDDDGKGDADLGSENSRRTSDLETPQSDVTVSTICNGYSTNYAGDSAESTHL